MRAEELDEGRVFVDALFRVEVEEVREGTGAWAGGCEVEGSLVLGAGLAVISASSFSKAFTFRVSESTWKLSFLRSLSTLEWQMVRMRLKYGNTTTYTRYLSSVFSISAHLSFRSSSISSHLS